MNILTGRIITIQGNGKDIQVLRYEHGQKYDPHYATFLTKLI
ncbi:hypothetical protein AAHE18_03G258200 [Arachis hypogaea]